MAAPMEDQDRAQALQARQDLEEVWGGRTWEKDKGKEREREPEVSDPDGEHQTKWRRPSHKSKGPSQSSWAGWGNGRNQRQWREEGGGGRVYQSTLPGTSEVPGQDDSSARARVDEDSTGCGLHRLLRHERERLPGHAEECLDVIIRRSCLQHEFVVD